jgi:hypothetical protein
MTKNSIHTLLPYWENNMWCFDDGEKNIHREPFVGTTNDIINGMLMLAGAPEAVGQKCQLVFSANKFPGWQFGMSHVRDEGPGAGDWYAFEEANAEDLPAGMSMPTHFIGQEGWLCPTLLDYFETAPKNIYIQAQAQEPEVAA